jgi:hypothetical protein
VTPAEASRLDFDELLVAGVCECGCDLDEHPPLASARPLRSWMAERNERRDLAPEMVGRIRNGGQSWSIRSSMHRRNGPAA